MNKRDAGAESHHSVRPDAGIRVVALALAAMMIQACGPGALVESHGSDATAASFSIPAKLDDGWQTMDPAHAGFDQAHLRDALRSMVEPKNRLHGIVVERHGKLVAELYLRGEDKQVNTLFSQDVQFGPEVLHDTRSVGKSVIGLLVGTAIGQGRIQSVRTPVIGFYPEYSHSITPQREAITLQHLLAMSSGLNWDEGGDGPDDEHKLMWKWSPVRYVLDRPIAAAPGASFNYNSGGVLVVADILSRTSGMDWDEYARVSLFEPLGIHDVQWAGDFHGRPMAYTGLRMRPRDMAKIGRLVLDHGRWQGTQVVPEDWIAKSMQPKRDTGLEGTRYGYLWWLGTVPWQGRTVRWAAAFGNGGQRIYVIPELDMTVVITSGAYDDPAAARRSAGFLAELVSAVRSDHAADAKRQDRGLSQDLR